MIEETFLRLQHSEGIVCAMASRLLAAHIASGRLTDDNAEELIDRSISMAIQVARKADRAIESDNESSE